MKPTAEEIAKVLSLPEIGQAMLFVARSNLDWSDSLDHVANVATTLSEQFAMSTPQVIREGIEQLHAANNASSKIQMDLVFDIALRMRESTPVPAEPDPAITETDAPGH